MLPQVPAFASPYPQELTERADRLSFRLNPVVAAWIEKQAREEVAAPRIDEFRLRQIIARRFTRLSTSEADALVFLVMKAAAGLMETTFRDTLKLIWALNEERQRLRAELALYLETRPLLRDAASGRPRLWVVPPVSEEHLQELDETAAEAAARMHGLSEQRNRLLAALYGLMKKPVASPAQLSRLG